MDDWLESQVWDDHGDIPFREQRKRSSNQPVGDKLRIINLGLKTKPKMLVTIGYFEVTKETEKAICLKSIEHTNTHWIAKSQIKEMKFTEKGMTICIEEWLFKKEFEKEK